MLQSDLFTKTLKEAPKDEESVNARLLVRAGFVDKLGAGIYNFLPLGLRVLNKIVNILREEMNAIGGQEILMAALHPRSCWETTGRFKVPEMFKFKSQTGKEYGLGWTHEEIITSLLQKFIFSYHDLPKYVYQIQTKMRDELRAKSGILRTREFLMKDLYSFHENEEDLNDYYEKAAAAYVKIFKRCGIAEKTYRTLAFGGTFSKYSDEFQTIAEGGEDVIHICSCGRAFNSELIAEIKKCPDCDGDSNKFKQEKAIEVGNIFKLGTGFSKPFNFTFKDKNGADRLVIMGCYGIGPTRLLGAVVESCYDKRGIVWPETVAPFDIHLLELKSSDSAVNKKIKKTAEKIYRTLQNNGKEVLYDERDDVSIGEKFADCDLIGIPLRMIISEKTLAKESVEIKKRDSEKLRSVKIKDIVESV